MIQLSDWLGYALGVLALILSIPISLAVGRRTGQRPDIRSALDFSQISGLGHQFAKGLSVAFDGRPLDEVSRTLVAVWNFRGRPVRGGDILDSDPLRFEVGNGNEILQVRLVTVSRRQTALDSSRNEARNLITFDFLDDGDGGIFEVLHTGAEPANIVGTIPGATFAKPYGAALTRGARGAMQVSRFRRLGLMRRSVRIRTISEAAMAIAAIVLALSGLWALWLDLQPPILVPVVGIDLATLEGQAVFARHVRDVGQKIWLDIATSICVVVLGSAFAFLAIRRIDRRTRRIVPASIVAVDLDKMDAGT